MKTYLDCIPCFLRQALNTARLSTKSEKIHKQILDEISALIPKIDMNSSPPEIAVMIYGKIAELTKNHDPFREIKSEYIAKALEYIPYLQRRIIEADDKMEMAIRIGVAGNIIDFGAAIEFDLQTEIDRALDEDFAIFDLDVFKSRLEDASQILVIGDNAGETVFDRMMIEALNVYSDVQKVYYAVRDVPIINDAITSDAIDSGIDKVARIISSGSIAPGTILKDCNKEFLKIYENSDIVIAKGMGNYESLSDAGRDIFFLLRAKCPMVARDVGCNLGDLICWHMDR